MWAFLWKKYSKSLTCEFLFDLLDFKSFFFKLFFFSFPSLLFFPAFLFNIVFLLSLVKLLSWIILLFGFIDSNSCEGFFFSLFPLMKQVSFRQGLFYQSSTLIPSCSWNFKRGGLKIFVIVNNSNAWFHVHVGGFFCNSKIVILNRLRVMQDTRLNNKRSKNV